MKRKILFILAAIVTVAACCQKEDIETNYKLREIVATRERPSDINLKWQGGDDIRVFVENVNSDFNCDYFKETGEAVFDGVLKFVFKGEHYDAWAISPDNKNVSFDGSSFTAKLPITQIAVQGGVSNDVMISASRFTDDKAEFRNLCGGISFTLSQSGINRVVVKSRKSEALSGMVKFTVDDSNVPVVQNVESPVDSVVLVPPDSKEFIPGKTYSLTTFPGELSAGFDMYFYKNAMRGKKMFGLSTIVKRSDFKLYENADNGVNFEQFFALTPPEINNISESSAEYKSASYLIPEDGEFGFIYSTSRQYLTLDKVSINLADTVRTRTLGIDHSFDLRAMELSSDKTYYCRAFCAEDKSVFYSETVAFTTKSLAPERYALDAYWSDSYTGPYGIQIGFRDNSVVPAMMLAGQPLFVTGTNCYNLFIQSVGKKMSTTDMVAAINKLSEEKVPIVRFSGSVYSPSEMTYYFDHKEEFFANLETLAALCDQKHILLIPSVFWQIACLHTYFKEDIKAWGDTESKTYKFMESYTKEIVDALKGHKCLAAWEFGNEFNLAADIAIAGYPDISASAIGKALEGFSKICDRNDPHKRMISSGNSVMRNAQWHLAYQQNWGNDSFEQYKMMTSIMTPELMKGISEHLYDSTDDARIFSDLGYLDKGEQVDVAMKMARQLGKVYYVGEFTGSGCKVDKQYATAEIIGKHYQIYYDHHVQLSMVWNYALKGDIEWSFAANTPQGDMAFGFVRELNGKFKKFVQN